MSTFSKGLALAVLLASGLVSAADTISLSDGDQLSGTLIEIADGITMFRTELAGQLILPLARVTSITTTRDVQIVFKDGGRGVGRLVTSDGEMRFIPKDEGEPYPVATSMLVSVAPVRVEEAAPLQPDELPGVSASLGTGAQATTGNDDYVSLYARLQLETVHEAYRWTADAIFTLGQNSETLGHWRVTSMWRWLPDARLRPAIELAIEHDADQLLDSRVSVFAGGEQTLWEARRQQLTGLLGVSLEAENWSVDERFGIDRAPDSGWEGARAALYYRAADLERDNTDLRLRLNLRHTVHVFDRFTWEEQVSLYPSLRDAGNWRGAYESTVLYPLADRLRLNLGLRVDYDSEPAFRYLDQWRTTVGAGIEWSF